MSWLWITLWTTLWITLWTRWLGDLLRLATASRAAARSLGWLLSAASTATPGRRHRQCRRPAGPDRRDRARPRGRSAGGDQSSDPGRIREVLGHLRRQRRHDGRRGRRRCRGGGLGRAGLLGGVPARRRQLWPVCRPD